MADRNNDARLAERVSAALANDDAAARLLGIEVLEVRPGFARLAMMVRPEMANGHGICHGGMVFALADTAFAHACNSRNYRTVASGCQIDYVRPAQLGERLTAEAIERAAAGRTGVYDVSITNESEQLIAVFRGKSYRLSGEVVASAVE